MARERRHRRLNLVAQLECLEPRWLMSGLIQPSDLGYLGAFKLPGGTFGASSFDYGGTALAYNPANNSLFMVGHDWDQAIAEVSIPTPKTGGQSSLNTANVLQSFRTVIDRVPDYPLTGTVKVGGLMVADGQLYGTLYEFYDADANAIDSHFKLSSLNLATANVSGLYQVGSLGGGYVGGYMTAVPQEWQAALGTEYLTGQAALSIISRTSSGPAAFGFDPGQLGASPAPAEPFVYYPLDLPLAPPTTQNPTFNLTTQISGIVFPEGTDSVLFFGSHGVGEYWYGEANEGGRNDSQRSAKGSHAPPYVYQVWAYDANDFVAVKNGLKQPWQVQPYNVWTLDLPYAGGGIYIGGTAYDAATGRLYVSQKNTGDFGLPIIHTFQVGAPTPDTQPPAISGVASSGVTAAAATIAWTTNEAADTQVEYGTTTSYGSSTTLNTALVTSHSANLAGLAANTTYHFRVKSRDAAGNLATSADFTFTTASADSTAPTISGVTSSAITSSAASIGWTTNEASDTQVEYGTTTGYGSSTTLSTSLVTSHSASLSGLAANTTYHYRVKSRDAAGNLASSADFTFTTAAATTGTVYSYNNPPPLPPPTGTVINVSTVNQLVNAINNLQSGQTISIAAGTYDLTGVTDALYIPQGISNFTIRGATGNRADVVIQGAGMNGSVRFGFWLGTSTGGTIADLTIDGVSDHGIIANPGAHNLLVHNVRIVDAGDQFLKSNPDANGVGNSGGIVEYSVFEYRTTDNDNYTNGVDVHGGDDWIVRYNLFKNFLSPVGQGVAGPAILMWNGTTDSTIEGNTFINCARGISLGLIDKAGGFDHQGGVIQNNMFYRDAGLASAVDVPIYIADSPNTQVYHNTIIARGSYPSAIEYRFASTTGLQIKNNLSDGGIQARDGAAATLGGNVTNAALALFVNPTAGDLHLASGASPINQGVAISGFTLDIDGQARDAQLDVGADEFISGSADTTPPTISGVGSSGLTANTATVFWTTDEASDTQVEYGLTTAYGSSTTLNTALVTSHSANLTGLTANTTYHFRVKSRDAAGNLRVSGNFTFTTAAAPDTTAPVISGVGSSNISSNAATIAWLTNEAADTQVEYGLTTAYGISTTLNTAMVTSHSANLTGLASDTTYHFRVKSRDAAGNLATSGDFTFTTAGASTATDWGTIDSQTVNDQTFTGGERWFEVASSQAGTLTVEALFTHSQGNVNLAIFDASFQLLASSNSTSNNERVDIIAPAAGTTYFIRVTGSNPNVDFRLTNLLSVNGTVVDVAGTANADSYLWVHASKLWFNVNGAAYSFNPGAVTAVNVDGEGGADSFEARLNGADDDVVFRPDSVEIDNPSYAIEALSETNLVKAGRGFDEAWFHDSADDDSFVARPTTATMLGTGFSNTANGFDKTYAYADAGGLDRATLYDGSGNDLFRANPDFASYGGNGFFNWVSDFDEVYARHVNGGFDRAEITGSAGNDTLEVTGSVRRFSGADFKIVADRQDRVNIVSGGGDDVADFFSMRNNDEIYGRDNYAETSVAKLDTWIANFTRVRAHAQSGHRPVANVRNVDYLFERFGNWKVV